MADNAQTDARMPFSAMLAAHARNAKPPERPADKVVSLQSRASDAPQSAGSERTVAVSHAPAPDYSSAIELVREASEAIRISEDRAVELEDQLEQFSQQASEQLRQLNAEVVARDQRLAQTEERLRLAEARADEAETWLRKLHDAVHSSFSSLRR